jgi:hypothetical protein
VETEGTWVQILRNKYLQSKTLFQVTVRPNDLPFWKGLMRTKAAFFHRTKFIIGNGNSTRFWEDTWLGETPLATQYPSLYNIVQHKEAYVATMLQSNPLNIQFRRSLVGARWEAWLHLVRRLMDVNLSDESDSIHWKLTPNVIFSVKSIYLDLIDSSPIPKSIHILKIKVPLRIKIFMWFVHKEVILTKDNLAKHNWEGSQRCCFCDQDETIKHLFLDCPLATLLWRSIRIASNITPPNSIHTLFGTWLNGVEPNTARHIRIGVCALLWVIWNCGNDMVFNRQTRIIFLQVIYRATAWIRAWSLLTPVEARGPLVTGSTRWEMVAWDI